MHLFNNCWLIYELGRFDFLPVLRIAKVYGKSCSKFFITGGWLGVHFNWDGPTHGNAYGNPFNFWPYFSLTRYSGGKHFWVIQLTFGWGKWYFSCPILKSANY